MRILLWMLQLRRRKEVHRFHQIQRGQIFTDIFLSFRSTILRFKHSLPWFFLLFLGVGASVYQGQRVGLFRSMVRGDNSCGSTRGLGRYGRSTCLTLFPTTRFGIIICKHRFRGSFTIYYLRMTCLGRVQRRFSYVSCSMGRSCGQAICNVDRNCGRATRRR